MLYIDNCVKSLLKQIFKKLSYFNDELYNFFHIASFDFSKDLDANVHKENNFHRLF